MKVRVGSADIYLERGDITEYEVDAIVNAANSEPRWAGVASAIKRKGGTIVEEEAGQGARRGRGCGRHHGGQPPCELRDPRRGHGPGSRSSADLVRRATLSSLRRAEELRLHSIAFPAFGTGVGRVEPKDAAEAMVGALRAHFAETKESSLRRSCWSYSRTILIRRLSRCWD
jgi:O-acetyl-ADP-ribose deacetylase (regulator of RNase III)